MTQSENLYTNPVIAGFHPDPSICRVGNNFYLVTSSFQYFPGVPIFHSRDLVNWQQLGHCLTRKSQLNLEDCKSSMGIYAPTLRYHQGRFYMVTTNMKDYSNFLVWSEQAEGPWSDPIVLDWEGIDPSLFFDQNGKVYISGTNSFVRAETPGIYQAELDIETGKLLSERRLIWEGTGAIAPEGPHLYYRNDMYYLLIAEGGTDYGHMVTIARSTTPYGPFESHPYNPILTHRSSGDAIQATGHADFVVLEDGSWWAVFLGIRPVSVPFVGRHHHLGRETFLAPVYWSEDGWPSIGNNGKVAEQMSVEGLPLVSVVRGGGSSRDDFTDEQLQPYWNFLRNPAVNSWSLQEKQGWLTLHGTEHTLSDVASPAFIGRRQQYFTCKVTTRLSFDPVQAGEEAGLTVIMNEKFHYELAVTLAADGRRTIIFRRQVGTLWKVEFEETIASSEFILSMDADPHQYTFYYAEPGQERRIAGSGECYLLSTEVAGGYTGVYIGLYATGNGKPCQAPAFFDWFDYKVE